jgi:hypothetical protein
MSRVAHALGGVELWKSPTARGLGAVHRQSATRLNSERIVPANARPSAMGEETKAKGERSPFATDP